MKDKLIAKIKEHFANLLEIDSTDFQFSMEAAIYYFASEWYNGMSDELYSIMCTSEYHSGAMETCDNWRKNDEIGKMIYDYILEIKDEISL